MKKRLLAIILSITFVCTLIACSDAESSASGLFKVTFLDVGQGDAALVECDGEYMLIDAGPKASGNKIRELLLDKGIHTLKYLVISHLHDDHYGGLLNGAVQNVTIENTLCNKDPYTVSELMRPLRGSNIILPEKDDDSYTLGSAQIRIIDVTAEDDNDSLVIMVEYGKTRFLFTGDIEKKAHSRVAQTLRDMSAELQEGENLLKMPHHGAYNSDPFLPDNASDNSLATLVSSSHATFFVVSVGQNQYNHPSDKTIQIIEQALDARGLDMQSHFFRTDDNGDITFTSDGNKIMCEN